MKRKKDKEGKKKRQKSKREGVLRKVERKWKGKKKNKKSKREGVSRKEEGKEDRQKVSQRKRKKNKKLRTILNKIKNTHKHLLFTNCSTYKTGNFKKFFSIFRQ